MIVFEQKTNLEIFLALTVHHITYLDNVKCTLHDKEGTLIRPSRFGQLMNKFLQHDIATIEVRLSSDYDEIILAKVCASHEISPFPNACYLFKIIIHRTWRGSSSRQMNIGRFWRSTTTE